MTITFRLALDFRVAFLVKLLLLFDLHKGQRVKRFANKRQKESLSKLFCTKLVFVFCVKGGRMGPWIGRVSVRSTSTWWDLGNPIIWYVIMRYVTNNMSWLTAIATTHVIVACSVHRSWKICNEDHYCNSVLEKWLTK